MQLWNAGELSFAHAVSTPYRNERSHFDGQDILEAGVTGTDGGSDGWLNRAMSGLTGVTSSTAFAIGHVNMRLLAGDAPFSAWSPDSALDLTPQAQYLLSKIYSQDRLFQQAAERAMDLSGLSDGTMMSPRRTGRAKALAQFTADRLREETRIAAFSISGWDTHASQANGLPRALRDLSEAILTSKAGPGPVWDKTAVLCLTEFGRRVGENGSRGTDHGTSGAAIFAGGTVKGQKVMTDWPGLASGDLYKDRDLMPTEDIRRYLAWAMHALFPIGRSRLEDDVFPQLEMGANPGSSRLAVKKNQQRSSADEVLRYPESTAKLILRVESHGGGHFGHAIVEDVLAVAL